MENTPKKIESKMTDLVVFSLMFIAEMALIISKLQHVSVYAFGRMEYPGYGSEKFWYPPLLDAQILAVLLILLGLGSAFFLVRLLRANKIQK